MKNRAKLAYRSVAAWLDGMGPMPEKVAQAKGLDEQLQLQDKIAQAMRSVRYLHGALELETIEPEAVMRNGETVELRLEKKNRATELIEDFIDRGERGVGQFSPEAAACRQCAGSCVRRSAGIAFGRVAEEFGERLPGTPDSKALGSFLARRRHAESLRFPDLSLTIIKLLGSGEYVVQLPGEPSEGHFGLAVHDYSHATAPNRRFPDLVARAL